MQSYIGDRLETPYGYDGAILPDGTKVIAVARSSAKNGTGIVVFKSTDGLTWETNYLSIPQNYPLAGVVIDPRDGRIMSIRQSAPTSTSLITYTSTDFGATWTERTVTHTVTPTYSVFNSMAWDSFNNRVLITNKNTNSATTAQVLILQSQDFGDTWTAAYTKPNNGMTATANLSQTDGGPYSVIARVTYSVAASSELICAVQGSLNFRVFVNPQNMVYFAQGTTVTRTSYNPINDLYLHYVSVSVNSNSYYSLFPSTLDVSLQTLPNLLSGEVTGAVAYSTASQGYVGTTRASAGGFVDQTLQRVVRSKYGNGGWLYEPTPLYNTSNVEVGFMLNDPTNNLLYTYNRGSIAEGNTIGYISTTTDMPAPSMTPTPSLSSAAKLNNDVVASGTFTSVNNIADYNRYALLANNGMDVKSVAMNFSTNAVVSGVLLVPNSNDVIIYGQFTTFAGATVNGIIRADRSGTINTDFNYTSAINNAQIVMAVYDADHNVYFTTSNGRIVKMNLMGTVDSSWGGTLPLSGAMAVHYDPKINKLYVANATRIYRVNIDGTLDNTFATLTTNGVVYGFAVQPDGKLVATGAFTNITWNGTGFSRPYIARFNTDGSVDTTWYFGFPSATQATYGGRALAVDDYGIYVSTSATSIDSTARNYFVRLKFDGRVDLSFNAIVNSYVYTISVTEDKRILIGGSFTTVNGTARLYGARLLADGSLDTTFTPATLPNSGLRGLIGYDQPLLSLTPTPTPSVTPTPSSVPLKSDTNVILIGNGLGQVNGNTTAVTGMVVSNAGNVNISNENVTPVTGGPPYGVCLTNDGTGDFFLFGNSNIAQAGHTNASILRVTKTGGFVSTFTSPETSVVSAMTPFTNGNYLFVSATNKVRKMDGNGVEDTAWGVGMPPTTAYTMLAYDSVRGKIYVGGSNNTLLCLNEDGTVDTSYTRTSYGGVSLYGMAVQPDGKLVISVSGSSNNIRRYNTNGTTDATFNVTTNGAANLSYGNNALAVTRDGIYIIGAFTTVNGVATAGLTRLQLSNGAIDPTWLPIAGANGQYYGVHVGEDQRPLVSGNFTQIRSVARAGVARLMFDGSLDTTFVGVTKTNTGAIYSAVPLPAV